MTIAIISILTIAGLVELVNRILFLRLPPRQAFRICPICAAVSGTWFWLTAAGLYGLIDPAVYQPIILLLMGGTVAGVAYQGEKSFSWVGRFPVAWKTAVVVMGIPLAFWAAAGASLKVLVLEAIVLLTLVYFFFVRRSRAREGSGPEASDMSELEKKLKDCC